MALMTDEQKKKLALPGTATDVPQQDATTALQGAQSGLLGAAGDVNTTPTTQAATQLQNIGAYAGTPNDATAQPVASQPLTAPTATTGGIQPAGISPLSTAPAATGVSPNTAVTNAPQMALPATTAQPGYQVGENFQRRPILGQDAQGNDVYGDWESYAQPGQFDANGNPLYNTTGYFNQDSVAARQSAANMTPAQRQQAFDALRAKYQGRLEQGNSGERLPYDADVNDQSLYDYLQQLTNADKYAPNNLPFLTSRSQIYGTSGSDTATQQAEAPEFFKRYGIGDPNYVPPTASPIDNGYRTIQGGEVYTDPEKAMAALRSISLSSTASDSQGSRPGGGGSTGNLRVEPTSGSSSAGSSSTNYQGSAPTLPGVNATNYGPGNDLQSTQINPTATDRGKIAQGYLDAFDARAEPMLRDRIRSVGQRAASLGQLGMGDVAVQALNPYTDYLKERAALSSELASRSAEGQIGDEANARQELRTERGYQTSQAQQAIENAIRQWVLQQQARQQEFNNGATLGQFGYGNSPSNLIFGAGQTYGNMSNSDLSALAALLGPYLTGSNRN